MFVTRKGKSLGSTQGFGGNYPGFPNAGMGHFDALEMTDFSGARVLVTKYVMLPRPCSGMTDKYFCEPFAPPTTILLSRYLGSDWTALSLVLRYTSYTPRLWCRTRLRPPPGTLDHRNAAWASVLRLSRVPVEYHLRTTYTQPCQCCSSSRARTCPFFIYVMSRSQRHTEYSTRSSKARPLHSAMRKSGAKSIRRRMKVRVPSVFAEPGTS